VIVLIFPAIFALSGALNLALGGKLPGMTQFYDLMASPAAWPLAAFISFMSGPWSEEFGWRGFALDRFLQRFGTIRGTIGLGLVWAIWHLPLYFMSTTWHAEMGFKLAGFWSFIALSVGLSMIMTSVYLFNRRSIFSALLLHFTSNFTSQLAAPISDTMEIFRSLLILAAGVAACLLLTRATQPQEQAEAVKVPARPHR
jgi:membrane protease YdiL (CAAX protease family)